MKTRKQSEKAKTKNRLARKIGIYQEELDEKYTHKLENSKDKI